MFIYLGDLRENLFTMSDFLGAICVLLDTFKTGHEGMV